MHRWAPNQIIWKRSSTNIKHEALDFAIAMGVFAISNYDSISSLNKEIEMKEQKLKRLKQEQIQQIT